MNRMGLCPVGSPYNITRMQCFGYMHTGVLWVLCMFFDHRITRYRMRTLKGSVRFMCGHRTGSCGFHTGLGIRLCMRAPCGCHKRSWQAHRYHKLRKTFSKFYRRHYELVSKFNVGLKTPLHQGLSEPEFNGDLVYKFKKIVGRVDFFDQFRKIIVRYKRIGYNMNIMRQSACLVFNPITVNNFASLFNCTPVGRASDSMMAPT